MEALGVAIIGPGKVAHTHARALRAVRGARLTAVAGRSPERTAQFAAQYAARPFTGLDGLLRDLAVQAVIICTPHPQHAAQAEAALRAGRHVLVEKPMATTTADCARMIAAAQASGAKLGVVSQRRLYPPVQRLKQALEAGKLGAPILGTVTVLGWRGPEYYAMDAWRGTWAGEGGGVLVNQTSHQLDLFQWLMGPVEAVFGYWANLNHPYIEVEDTAVAVLRFRGGGLGSLVVSNSQNPGLYGRIHIFGANGAAAGVQTDGGSMFVAGVTQKVEAPVNDLWTVPGEAGLLDAWQRADRAHAEQVDGLTYYHQLQIQDFVDAIRHDREPLVSGVEGQKAVAIFEAVYHSQRTGAPVHLAEAA